MKIVIIIIIALMVIAGIIMFFSEKPSKDLPAAVVGDTAGADNIVPLRNDVQADNASSEIKNLDFAFIGFGPGKSHPGTFENITVENLTHNDSGLNSGKITFDTTSVKTDSNLLDKDLCKASFFDCDNFPEIVFEITGSQKTESGYTVTGDLTFKGITKSVSFDATQNSGIITSNFRLNVEQFGFKAPVVDDEVEVILSAKI